MNIDINLIGNILIALIIYNMILRSIASIILKEMLKTNKGKKATEEVRKSFKERLADKKTEVYL